MRMMQMRRREIDVGAHATVDMDTEDGQAFATIGAATATSAACAAFEIRSNCDVITDRQRGDIGCNGMKARTKRTSLEGSSANVTASAATESRWSEERVSGASCYSLISAATQ